MASATLERGRVALVLAALSVGCAGPVPSEPAPGAARSAVIGGAADADHAAVVALVGHIGDSLAWCSGTLVRTAPARGVGYVATTADCIERLESPSVLQGRDLSAPDAHYDVLDVRTHPDWDPVTGDHDVALVRVATVDANTPVLPPLTLDDDVLMLGDPVALVGFGRTTEPYLGEDENLLRQSAPVSLDVLTPLFLRVTDDSKRACAGDNGAALVFDPGDGPRLAGVVSNWDETCKYLTEAYRASAVVADFLDDYASEPVADTCNLCLSRSRAAGGACNASASACDGNPACVALRACVAPCEDRACVTGCYEEAGASFVALDETWECMCNTCGAVCGEKCGPAKLGCAAPDEPAPDAYNACLRASCCDEMEACHADSPCWSCTLLSLDDPACAARETVRTFVDCAHSRCAPAPPDAGAPEPDAGRAPPDGGAPPPDGGAPGPDAAEPTGEPPDEPADEPETQRKGRRSGGCTASAPGSPGDARRGLLFMTAALVALGRRRREIRR